MRAGAQAYDPGQLSAELLDQLASVQPSGDGKLRHYPCRVTLRDGTADDCVYAMDVRDFVTYWDPSPATAPGMLDSSQILTIEPSPRRLPVEIANRIYEAGETHIGACLFTLVFRDGRTQSCHTGNAVDFVDLPAGLLPSDVVDVLPHRYDPKDSVGPLAYRWSLFRR